MKRKIILTTALMVGMTFLFELVDQCVGAQFVLLVFVQFGTHKIEDMHRLRFSRGVFLLRSATDYSLCFCFPFVLLRMEGEIE